VLTLIEQAEKAFDADQAAQGRREAHRQGGELHPRRLPRADAAGPQAGLAAEDASGCCPAWGQFRDQLENFDEREIDRIQAIIRSMTPDERANPKMIDGSRRQPHRPKAPGRQVSDVNRSSTGSSRPAR
jgi:signal recognition particle subunit SRP54